MKKGAFEFEEIAKIILAVVVITFVIILMYVIKDKIYESILGLRP